jgi:ElaB/YqjD/DUF883 family membrane-anchored ribosome-binding protein
MPSIEVDDRTRDPDSPGQVRQAASKTAEAAGSAVGDVADTAKSQAQTVVAEAKVQARGLASEVRERVGSEARGQNDRLADGLRRFADELDEMVNERDDSPARSVVSQVSQGGRRVADYLSERGPEGVLDELQDFARRRPGTFLAVAAAAGFVAGRLGKTAFSTAKEESSGTSDSGSVTGVARVDEPVGLTEPTYVGAGTPMPAAGTTAVYGSPTVPVAGEYGSVRP